MLSLLIATTAKGEILCQVKICNKLERFSLNPFSHLKDKFGETCFNATLPKEEAIPGKVLDSTSKWYQGKSWNPTKKSVTKIKEVYACT